MLNVFPTLRAVSNERTAKFLGAFEAVIQMNHGIARCTAPTLASAMDGLTRMLNDHPLSDFSTDLIRTDADVPLAAAIQPTPSEAAHK